jgi:hypothetical protein
MLEAMKVSICPSWGDLASGGISLDIEKLAGTVLLKEVDLIKVLFKT